MLAPAGTAMVAALAKARQVRDVCMYVYLHTIRTIVCNCAATYIQKRTVFDKCEDDLT